MCHLHLKGLTKGLLDFLRTSHVKPVCVRDASTGRTSRFRMFVSAKTSDNPMQSEASSHIGVGGNHSCRKCKIGGTTLEKETTEGYESLFHVRASFCILILYYSLTLYQVGVSRSKNEVLSSLQTQVQLACLGVMQPIKDIQTATGIKDAYTQYWIDDLLTRARNMKQADPTRQLKDIQAELLRWVNDHQDDVYSSFLSLKGRSLR